MEPAKLDTAVGRGLRWPARIGLLVLLAAASAWGIWSWWPRGGPKLPPDPRVVSDSPFRNTRPNVQYVGDAVCASCHQDIADTYGHHPMGRAMFPTSRAPELERYDQTAFNPFSHGPLHYAIERRDGKVIHAESLRDSKGQELARLEAEAEYAVGSGTRGRSYLINRDGFLFESPISWYTQKQRWDLSPGYHGDNSHFERPIQPGCLFCHCNQAHETPNTLNHYQPPYFTGSVIGCERCHGPGALHAEKPLKTDGIDYSIVNPRHLAPALREDVCQQCHLQGEIRLVTAGRGAFDYRPGLPLHEFLAVFVKPPELTQGMKAVSQVEQMYVSKCFQGSAGAMGCVSCHDPHRTPAADQKVAFYRQRCLKCHEDKPCALPAEKRLEQSASDSCLQCHMPRLGSNIAHTALTDHRVLRRQDLGEKGLNPPSSSGNAIIPLRLFHAERVDASTPTASRDFGIAITDLARRVEHQGPVVPLVRKAQQLLETGTRTWPGDAPAWDALGYALRKQGKFGEAKAAYAAALAQAPEREQTLVDLVDLATQTKQPQETVHYLERLVRSYPQSSSYQVQLAQRLHTDGQWDRSVQACRQALKLNIVHGEARRLLIANYLRLGKTAEAQGEFDLLVQAQPQEQRSLEAWFAAQQQAR